MEWALAVYGRPKTDASLSAFVSFLAAGCWVTRPGTPAYWALSARVLAHSKYAQPHSRLVSTFNFLDALQHHTASLSGSLWLPLPLQTPSEIYPFWLPLPVLFFSQSNTVYVHYSFFFDCFNFDFFFFFFSTVNFSGTLHCLCLCLSLWISGSICPTNLIKNTSILTAVICPFYFLGSTLCTFNFSSFLPALILIFFFNSQLFWRSATATATGSLNPK